MSAVFMPADVSAKSLEHLTVSVTLGNVSFWRDVHPVGDATLNEIVAAMKEDSDFGNPLVESGQLTVMRDRKCILLARYSLDQYDGWFDDAEIEEVTACFDDDTSESVAV